MFRLRRLPASAPVSLQPGLVLVSPDLAGARDRRGWQPDPPGRESWGRSPPPSPPPAPGPAPGSGAAAWSEHDGPEIFPVSKYFPIFEIFSTSTVGWTDGWSISMSTVVQEFWGTGWLGGMVMIVLVRGSRPPERIILSVTTLLCQSLCNVSPSSQISLFIFQDSLSCGAL